jgi:hypothetical protein
MNAGLGSLYTLKRHLLAPSLTAATTYDAVLTNIGKGVGSMLESAANRLFARVEDDTFTFRADVSHVTVPRYPIESVSLVDVKSSETDGFGAVTGQPEVINNEAGILDFGGQLGSRSEIARVTYTGGFRFDETDDDTGVQPKGTTILPDDLKLAWLMQCEAVWSARDKLGISLAAKPDGESKLAAVKLLPTVKDIIAGYTRFIV